MLPIYSDVATRDSIDLWRWYHEKLCSPSPELRHLAPDFLIIGAPKAGTSWLFSVLATHPGIFIPVEKELHYFNKNWRRQPIDDYLRRFEPGAERLKGEATTNYCRLPSVALEAVQRLNPKMKVMLLVRDPVEQSWSFMKHLFRYHDANFRRYQCLFDNLSDAGYLENFVDDVALSCASYRPILERWRRFFPRENFWLSSLEEIAKDPEEVYRSAVEFLGLVPEANDKVPLRERINEGSSHRLTPQTANILRTLHRRRARDFVVYAKREFDKDLSPLWRRTLEGDVRTAPRALANDFRGWDVVLHDGQLWGYRSTARDTVSATPEGLVAGDPSVEIHVADFNYELQRKLGILAAGSSGSDEDDRLERASSGLPLVTATFVVEEIEELGDYYCARMIARSEASKGAGAASISDDAQEALEIVDVTMFVGIRGDLWPPQPWMAQMLTDKGLPPIIFVGPDRELIHRQLAPFVRSQAQPIIEEEYRGFNIVRLRHDVIAIKQTLGAVDLGRPLDQLVKESDADDFIVDTDIGALRVRIAEVETRRNTRAIFSELHAHIERLENDREASIGQLDAKLATLQRSVDTVIDSSLRARALHAIKHWFGTSGRDPL